MHSKITGVGLSGLLVLAVGAVGQVGAADAKATAKVNYQEHVSAVFKNRCNSCHNADKQKGGLNLEDYGSTMRGGGSGAVVEPGRPGGELALAPGDAPGSAVHAPELAQAPRRRARGDQGVDRGGGPRDLGERRSRSRPSRSSSSSSTPRRWASRPGPPAMPENLPTEPVVVSARPNGDRRHGQ